MEITGIIKYVGQPRTGVSQSSGNNWESIEFAVEEAGSSQYPASYVLTLFNKPELKPFLQVGAMVTAKFDGKAHEYNGRWFNDLRCWAVSVPQAQGQTYSQAPAYGAPPQQTAYPPQAQAPAYGAPQGQAPFNPQGQMPFPPAGGNPPF